MNRGLQKKNELRAKCTQSSQLESQSDVTDHELIGLMRCYRYHMTEIPANLNEIIPGLPQVRNTSTFPSGVLNQFGVG